MTVVTVTHRKVVTIPDDPNYPVGSNEWNDNHVITGLAAVASSGSASDLSGLAPSATTDTTNASNITSGTLPAARLPTIPATLLPQVTIRKPASGATIAILTSDIDVGIDTRSTAVSVTLPSAAAWATANPFGLELVIDDYYGNAAANNITPALFSGDSFNWGTAPVVTENFGLLKLRPDPSLPGWVVRGVN